VNEELIHDEINQMYGAGPGRHRAIDSDTLRTPIKEISLRKPIVADPDTAVSEAVKQMDQQRMGSLLVVENERLVGVFTERDVLCQIVADRRDPDTTTLREVMTEDPSTLTPDHMLAYALNFMHVGGFRHVPIVDEENRPLGLLSVRDVLTWLAEFFPEDVRNLPPAQQGQHLSRHGG
jgi:CBS domain-containing protein